MLRIEYFSNAFVRASLDEGGAKRIHMDLLNDCMYYIDTRCGMYAPAMKFTSYKKSLFQYCIFNFLTQVWDEKQGKFVMIKDGDESMTEAEKMQHRISGMFKAKEYADEEA